MTDGRNTQIAIEEWSVADPVATAYQVALEEWGGGNSLGTTTQIAIEQWSEGNLGRIASMNQIVIEQWIVGVGGVEVIIHTQTRAMIMA